jgi:hypothetical protein
MSRFSSRSIITGSAVALAGVLVVGGVAVANASNDNRPLVSSVVPTSLPTSDPTNVVLDPTSTPIPEPSEAAEPQPTPEPSETAEVGDDKGLGDDQAGEDANEHDGQGDHGKGDTEEHGSVVVTPGSASTSNPGSGKHSDDNK